MNLPNGESNPLIDNEEHKKDDINFIENIFQKPSIFLIGVKKKFVIGKYVAKFL